jgi:hypothetical protein
MRSVLFCDISDRMVGTRYRRFGTNFRIHFKGREIQRAKDFFDFLNFEDRVDILSRNLGNILPLRTK